MDESAINQLIGNLHTTELIALYKAAEKELVDNRRYDEYLYFKDRIMFKVPNSNSHETSEDYDKIIAEIDRLRLHNKIHPILGAIMHDPWMPIYATDENRAETNMNKIKAMSKEEFEKFESILLK